MRVLLMLLPVCATVSSHADHKRSYFVKSVRADFMVSRFRFVSLFFTPSKLRQPHKKFFDVLTGAVLKITGCSDTSSQLSIV